VGTNVRLAFSCWRQSTSRSGKECEDDDDDDPSSVAVPGGGLGRQSGLGRAHDGQIL
jgi:hypothetical protein